MNCSSDRDLRNVPHFSVFSSRVRGIRTGLAIALLATSATGALADADEAVTESAAIECPADVGGMALIKARQANVCRYVLGNGVLNLKMVAPDGPTVQARAKTLAQKLNLEAREKATGLCGQAFDEKFEDASCAVSYDSHVISVLAEIAPGDRRMQALMMYYEEGGLTEKHLYWSISATRSLLVGVSEQ